MVAKEDANSAVADKGHDASASATDSNIASNQSEERMGGSSLKKAKTSANISEKKASKAGTGDSANRQRKDTSYIGWQQTGNWEEKDELTAEDELLDLTKDTLLDNVLPDAVYGDWYHFVGIIFLGGFLSFFLGYFKFSLAPVFFVIVVSTLFYRTSAKKYRGSIRDLVQKEFTVQKIENDYESFEWLNSFLDKYWPILEPSVSQMVVEQVNEILATNTAIPSFITAIWIDKFTVGVKPPRVEAAKTFLNTAPDVVVMDWILSFTPHDLSDMTAKQVRNYVNEEVMVKAKMFGMTPSVTVSELAFKAKARVRFTLMTAFPHVETVNLQLLEVPDIDFVATVFGNSIFNWELMSFPGLTSFIKLMANKYMGPILLPPFSLQLNIPTLLSDSNVSIGIVEITIKKATDLKTGTNVLNQSVDPYLCFELDNKKVGQTRTVRDTLNPIWNETLFVLLSSYTVPLTISVMDKRSKLKDKKIGRIEFNMNSLYDNPNQRDIKEQFLRNSKPVGELVFDLKFFPTLQARSLPDGTVEEMPDLNTGIAKIVLDDIEGIAEEKKKESYSVDVYMNAKFIGKTSKGSSSEVIKFGDEFESIIPDRRKTRYRFVVKDSKNNVVTAVMQSLNDLIDRSEIDKKQIPLRGTKGALKVSTYWRPVRLDFGNNSIAYTPPIGVLRVFINRADNLLNLEKIGKIGPYTKVLVNGTSRGRTEDRKGTLSPVWNQSIYVAVTSPNQRITLEVMDVETSRKDRSVGKFNIDVQDLFHKNKDNEYEECIDKSPRTGRLITKKGPRGNLTYYLSFYPTLPVLTLEEMEEAKKLEKKRQFVDEHKDNAKKLTEVERQKLEEEKLVVEEMDQILKQKKKLELNELMDHKSGVLAVSVLDGTVPQPGVYVQAFFDGNNHSRFTSPRMNSAVISNGWTGDVAIKELDYSMTTFRVTENPNASKGESCLCEVSLATAELIKGCYHRPSIVQMSGEGGGKLLVQVQWFPIDVKELPQSDLITNSGELTVLAKNADNLTSADTNGYSDPYLKFFINDEKNAIFKTHVEKKTLNPVWNEAATFPITNRVNDTLRIRVMDWDMASGDDAIGTAVVNLADVKPEGTTPMDVPVTYEGQDGGMLHLEFSFSAKYVTARAPERQTKTAEVTTKGLGTGLKAGTTVVNTGIGAVGKIGKGIFHVGKLGKGKGKKEGVNETEADTEF
ncbi:uncharacterized protein KNAG_0E01610 [Huiozyma naganishii CBS 8797]|uniref:Tricalbin n=1 Tax=Huiozyma naganishii (strain ATCC MYA-139 / BCRC 22969 / CBS 8797 / KCTC 17520 / NBRC 10181 / NCYC 3082 / Yp74L-3) TaxID=1071383 RepID=J7RLL4_HUIN7|nr:hypothetical protein KNAG_0E01610 [Kazachstania naganishii CBS 8797]CCK70423.1 hypothetical protein KNAG_0E01610 [Kazachstania naganishii CBS 8797]